MADLLLLSGDRLIGARRVTMTVRPERVAFLVDPDDQAVALAAVQAACLQWGGQLQFLIPCPPGGVPGAPWARILDKHDPDVVVDLVGAAATFASDQWHRLGRAVHRWERPTETMHLVGATVYSVLRRWQRERPADYYPKVLHLTPLLGHPLALPLAFRWGSLDRRPMDPAAILEPSYRSTQHSDFLEVRTFDPSAIPEHELVRFVTETPLAPSTPDKPGWIGPPPDWNLPALTTIALPRKEPSYRYSGEPNPERDQHDEAYVRRLVVVGGPSSVPDLCLAWNLRAQRMADWRFPIWALPQWLRDDAVRHRVERALQLVPDRDLGSGDSALHLVSATMTADDLAAAAPKSLPRFVAHDVGTLDRFFSPAFRAGLTARSINGFQDGVVDVTLPDYTLLADFDPVVEDIGWTLSIEGYAAPRGSGRGFPLPGVPHRLAGDGLAGFIAVGHPNPGELMEVGTHDGLEIVRAVAARVGYDAAISDKGQLAISIINLFDGPGGLSVLASSGVYALLQRMAQIASRRAVQQALRRRDETDPSPEQVEQEARALEEGPLAGGQFDRQHLTWADIKAALRVGPDTCDAIVEWLVARRIFLQGYKTACRTCGLIRWYPISRLAETHRCDGCQVVSPVPVSLNALHWSYRLNEVVAQAVVQGVLPHLLALHRMRGWAEGMDADLLGFLPGVLFKPREVGGPPGIEVDLLAIKGGRVVVGECKASGHTLDETGNEVERFAALGKRLDCSRIVYATPTNFEAIPEVIARAKTFSAPVRVETWEASDLLDPRDHPEMALKDPAEYLGKVAEWLRPTNRP